jgi:signal transduction histidine kinase
VRTALSLLGPTKVDGVDLVLNLRPDTPEILADAVQIEQVILNLTLNALEASPPPGRVDITTGRQKLEGATAARLDVVAGEYAFLRVQDQGTGIREEHMKRLFEPFFTTKPMGRGMGLATTRAIVRDHHGQVRLESVPGEGTTVTAWLPAAKAPKHAPAAKRKGHKER